MKMDTQITLTEAAERLGISKGAALLMNTNRQLPVIHRGDMIFCKISHVEALSGYLGHLALHMFVVQHLRSREAQAAFVDVLANRLTALELGACLDLQAENIDPNGPHSMLGKFLAHQRTETFYRSLREAGTLEVNMADIEGVAELAKMRVMGAQAGGLPEEAVCLMSLATPNGLRNMSRKSYLKAGMNACLKADYKKAAAYFKLANAYVPNESGIINFQQIGEAAIGLHQTIGTWSIHMRAAIEATIPKDASKDERAAFYKGAAGFSKPGSLQEAELMVDYHRCAAKHDIPHGADDAWHDNRRTRDKYLKTRLSRFIDRSLRTNPARRPMPLHHIFRLLREGLERADALRHSESVANAGLVA